ncbi:MAG: hypothetical protein A3G81_20305 [Betaproteobacteria bacterium RIFCSPLOWO2_12_FULL_65_14]|nr:MAG: hypothetical protein A3G81_20305 [Betaproteobacteria bacterium RIFCSPLOWO2_12_FULL_65_14]
MGRAVVGAADHSIANAFPEPLREPAAAGSVAPQEKPDTYRDRLFKYIPAEVVTLYLGLSGVLATAADAPQFLHWVIFFAGLVGTPFYLLTAQNVTSRTQLVISTLAFAVWVFALGGPFKDLAGYKQIYGAVLLPLFTFFVAGISPGRADTK